MKVTLIAVAMVLVAIQSFAATVILSASKDNTLFQNPTGSESSGIGDSFFAGRTGNLDGMRIRRGTIAFDLSSSIPTGAIITDVTLTLFLAQAGSAAFNKNASLFAATADWGEGMSRAVAGVPDAAATGDATWLHRFYPTSTWASPGGDFAAQPSATLTIGSVFQPYSWSGAGLVEDVQEWVADPTRNFGWILRGEEVVSTTALRFNSREATDAAKRPRLTINYTVVPEPSASLFLLGTFLAAAVQRLRRVNRGGCSLHRRGQERLPPAWPLTDR